MLRYWVSLLLFVVPVWGYASEFPVFKEIEPNIRFWTKVYSEWTTKQIVFADSEDLNLVYRVISLPDTPFKMEALLEQSKQEIREALSELAKRQPSSEQGLTGLVKELYLALRPVQRTDKYERGDWIRSQNGLSDRFALGLKLSGTYEEEIHARLLYSGLPKELIAIVFVESLFYVQARSSAGAAGLWQFLQGTAKETVRINRLVDERFDPALSTESAITYLQKAYQQLGSWPLAITSYNCGRWRMKQAVEQVGSNDYVEVLKGYEHPRFGFAARNYYSEVLAALHVYSNAATYFPNTERNKPWRYVLYQFSRPLIAKDMFQGRYDLEQEFYLFNPAIKKRSA